jgi:hypothetical protein
MRLSLNPHDNAVAAVLRFVLELAALFAIGAAFGVMNLLVSALVIGLFNAKGDKRFQGIQISGWLRLAIEVFIALMGIYGAYIVLGPAAGGAFLIVWVVYLYVARERLVWLVRGERNN